MSYQQKKSIRNVGFFILAFCVSLTVEAEVLRFTGVATDLETGRMAYTEKHEIILSEEGKYLSSTVKYIGASGQLYANRKLDFRESPLAPLLDFKDVRTKEQFMTSRNGDVLLLKTVEQEKEETVRIDFEANDTLVVDAGFDQLLMQHWDRLLSGKEKEFQFLALTRRTTIKFELALVETKDGLARFEIEPANWVISLLVDPIVLDYDLSKKRLMRYEGITNIAKEGTGKNYSAVIEYYYDDHSSLASAPHE